MPIDSWQKPAQNVCQARLAVRHGDLATSGDENARPHRRPERGEGYFQIRLMKKILRQAQDDPSTSSG
jgi:hypothetical protein